jgi:hypothetical protein
METDFAAPQAVAWQQLLKSLTSNSASNYKLKQKVSLTIPKD